MNFQLIEGDVLLRDAQGNPIAAQVDGNYYQLATSDQHTQDLLAAILIELRKLNMHMTLINGDTVRTADVG